MSASLYRFRIPGAEFAKELGLKVCGYKDFILMQCMNAIMGADAKKTRERLVLSEIADMERKYDMTSSEFRNKFESGALGDDQDYFVWWSLIRGLEAVRARKEF